MISTGGGSYGTHYLRRAYYSLIGLGANIPQDAVYPVGKVDGAGKPMSGASSYRIHFAKGETPPVDGFWSLTMYQDLGYFVPNSLDRYKLGQPERTKAGHKRGRIGRHLDLARKAECSRKQLAAGTERCVLHGLPPVLAEDDAAFSPRWDLESAARDGRSKSKSASSFAFESAKERNASGAISEMLCHRPSIKCLVASLSGDGVNELPSR